MLLLATVAAVFLSGGQAAAFAAELQNVRLRLEWGGGQESVWQGTVSAAEGNLSDAQPLGVEADEPGSMWTDSGALEIRARTPRAYDGVDVTVHAPMTSQLRVQAFGPRQCRAR